MVALISWTNWLDLAGAVLAASSEAPTLPVTNLTVPRVRVRWRTLAGVTSPRLDVDFGRVREVGVLALVQPDDCGGIDGDGEARGWMQASDTVRHRLDASVPGAGALLDTFPQPGGWQREDGIHVHRLEAAVTAQYWRCNIAAASLATVPGFLDIGRAWAGPAWTPARGNFAYGWSSGLQSATTIETNERSGGEFVDRKPAKRVLSFAFNVLTAADAAALKGLQRAAAKGGQALVQLFEDNREQPVLGRLVEIPPISQPNFAAFQVAFQLRQSL